MKKTIILSILIALAVWAQAQDTILPRYGTTKNNDNTGRVLTWGYITPVPVNDSIKVVSGYYKEIINPAQITAAIAVCADTTHHKAPLANAYIGDEQVFIFNANTHSGGWTVAFDYGYATASGTFTIGSAKTATISFVFDGETWRETSRGVE